MSVITPPTATVAPEILVNKDQRRIEAIYTFEDTRKPAKYEDDGTQVSQLSISVSHDRDRKHYRVSINRMVRTRRFVRVAIRFGQGQPVKDWAVPVNRFSMTTLKTTFEETLGELNNHMPALEAWAKLAVEEEGDH
jgi:hypothetical protein